MVARRAAVALQNASIVLHARSINDEKNFCPPLERAWPRRVCAESARRRRAHPRIHRYGPDLEACRKPTSPIREEGHTFLFGLSDGRVIDGSLGGNSARWLNHACVANCEAVESDGRVYIQAVSNIKAGEELFIAYGLTTEGRASAAVRAQHACRCGHRRCRGTMLAGV